MSGRDVDCSCLLVASIEFQVRKLLRNSQPTSDFSAHAKTLKSAQPFGEEDREY
jgi:hypothetical protein